jgi:hypothetical protein
MRFHWLQVDADFIAAHAGDLAAHLGISRREAIGMAVDLWTWALARASDDAPPDGLVIGPHAARLIAGAAQWPGDHRILIDALVSVGMASAADGGIRLRGLGRYRSTWDKNRRRKGSLGLMAGPCVYFIQSGDSGPVKIGYSDDPGRRLAQLQTGHPESLVLLCWIAGGPTKEREVHDRFRAERLREDGEWFRPSADLMAYIGSVRGGVL